MTFVEKVEDLMERLHEAGWELAHDFTDDRLLRPMYVRLSWWRFQAVYLFWRAIS